jgi:hypothetical protein
MNHSHWVHSRSGFFLPIRVLSRVFRGKFISGLKQLFRTGKLAFAGKLKPLATRPAFDAFLRPLFRKDWVVYAKPPFGGPDHLLHYLARYTHRVAISNHRLIGFENDQVTFRWKDYAHSNKKRKMTLTADEFLRRFLLHVLPRGFVRIRFFGFLANRRRAALLSLCQRLVAEQIHRSNDAMPNVSPQPISWSCPKCSTPMLLIERFSASSQETRLDTS